MSRESAAAPAPRASVRVEVPYHLQNLAKIGAQVTLEIVEPVTTRSILDALEARHPVLRGTLRDPRTGARRPMVRFFACAEDLSNDSLDAPLPTAIAAGKEPFLIIGAIAGG